MKRDGKLDDLAVVDAPAFERLRDWGGDELVAKMLDLFMEHAPRRMAQIRSGLDDDALEETQRGAHSLKSSAGQLGALRLQVASERMEDLAEEGDRSGALSLLPALESAYTLTRDSVEEMLKSLS